jgi:hypothetical protein
MLRNLLLTIHVWAIAAWIGAGFLELYLGRRFLATEHGLPEVKREAATLLRLTYQADLGVFAATLAAFGAGLAMTFIFEWGFLTGPLWLTIKQVIMLGVLATVILILPRALRLGGIIGSLPKGAAEVPAEGYAIYRRLEPWYLAMRLLALLAAALAIFRI